MKNLKDLVRPCIWDLKPYSSARDEYKGRNATVFLDANENPYHAPYNRYPDPLQEEVKALLAPIKGVSTAQLFLGNGSDEAIDLTFRVFCRPGIDNVVAIEPTYGMYAVCADVNDVEYRRVLLEGDYGLCAARVLKACDANTKVIFLCSPNNPTGNILATAEIEYLLNEFEGIVVLDEAYIDFATSPSWSNRLNAYPNLLIYQTFSKAWGCAGIRLGVAMASPDIISFFNKVKYPYNVNVLTQQKAKELLQNYAQIETWVQQLIKDREVLMNAFKGLNDCVEVYPTQANFFLARMRDASAWYQALVQEGIIVRNRDNVVLCENCLRVTVGTPEENAILLKAMNNIKM